MTKRIAFALILLFGIGFTKDALGGQVLLMCDPNTEPDLAGYKIYYGQTSGVYGPPTPIDTGMALDSNHGGFTVTGLNDGETYYFAATAYDVMGNESSYSNEVEYTIQMTSEVSPSTIALVSGTTWYKDKDRSGTWNGVPTDTIYTFTPPNSSGATPMTGDWNRDGSTEIGLFLNGTVWLDLDGDGIWDGTPIDGYYTGFGTVGDIPLVGDWNGDGIDKLGLFRPAYGYFYFDKNGNRAWDGIPTDGYFPNFKPPNSSGATPMAGDWNRDGSTEIGLFLNGTVWLDLNGDGIWNGTPTDGYYTGFGTVGDIPLVGDWTGDGIDKLGLFRPAYGYFYFDKNGNRAWDGIPTDGYFPNFKPVTGGKPVVFR